VQGTWFDCPVPGGRPSTVVGCTLDLRAAYGADVVTHQ